jgi:hypothetical protein
MKKALVGFLVLALSAGAFAQEAKEQGLKLGGALKTGIQFQTDSTKDDPGEHNVYAPSIHMYNDDADAETRIDLDGSFTKDNYGVVFRLRTDTVITGPKIEVNQAYVWADFLNQVINVKVGKIDDSTWNTGGDEDFHYSTGTGLRLEVKPIEGLNVGLFLNGPNQTSIATAWNNGKLDEDQRYALGDQYGESGFTHSLFIFAKEFLLETAFGAKYESEAFYVAGGLRIDGKADGLDIGEDFYDYDTYEPTFTSGDSSPPGENENADKGLGIYAGFGVTAIEPLTAIVEARFNNVGGYADYGWIWINETFGYAITEQLEAGLVMHQRLFGGDNKFVSLKDNASVSPYLTFKPYVSYALNDKWTVGLDIPLGFWPDIIDYDIGVKPKVSYKLGENASINAFYLFDLIQHGTFGYDDDVMKKPDSIIQNTVQIDFIWTF